MICAIINQRIAPLPTVEAEALLVDQGEMADAPSPVPKIESMTHNEAVTNAPATTAAQEMPDEYASCSVKAFSVAIGRPVVEDTIWFLLLVVSD